MLVLATVVVAVLATLSTAALISMTSALRRTTVEVAAALESVRLAEEAEINLLLHTRTTDPIVQRDIESELRGALAGAEKYVTSSSERAVLQQVLTAVETYLRMSRDPATEPQELASAGTAAFAALEQLVDLNVAHKRSEIAEANTWDKTADFVGYGVAGALIFVLIALALWLKRQVLRPWFALADAMKRFADGDRLVRAAEEGPAEVVSMSRSFNGMAEAIATQRQAQVAFLGGVAHDLRTPLSALQLAVDMLGPDEPLPPEPQLRKTVAVMARQLNQLERMLGDFVDMSQIEAGRLDLRVDERDMRPVVRDAVRLFASADPSRDFRVSLPDDSTMVMCDDVRIGQVVTNLVSNAVKYSPRSQPIEVELRATDDDAILEVKDHGAGISAEDQRRLFEPFRRVGDKKAALGTGLGLFSVKRIVEAHGGHIEVESEPGRGSMFRVVLRRAPVLH